MPDNIAQPAAADDRRGRQIVCQEFARMAERGYGQFRVRWFPTEQRVQFQGERGSRWETVSDSEYAAADARFVAAALAGIRDKRNNSVQIRTRKKPDYEDFQVRIDAGALDMHRHQLAQFVDSQLFWD